MSTPESTSERRTPGQGMRERLEQRLQRRPSIGMSPEFYARFGLSDPWSDTPLELQDDPGKLFTYVDATRFRTMMRRLAFSRWRRERRARLFGDRRLGLQTALRRGFPGEAKHNFAFGVRTLGLSEMIVPEAAAPEVAKVPAERAARRSPSFRRGGLQPISDSWVSPKGAAARTMRTTGGQQEGQDKAPRVRALDRIGERLSRVRAAKAPVLKALNKAMPRMDAGTRRRVQKVLRVTEHLDEQTRIIEVRRVLRRVRTVYEDEVASVLPSAHARPTEVARARSAPASTRKRGLRPLLSSSPSMSVIAPAQPEAAPPESSAPAGRRAVARGRTRSVSAWARPAPVVRTEQRAALSASPVTRGGGRTARTAEGRFVAQSRPRVGAAPRAADRPGVKRSASARAVGVSGPERTQVDAAPSVGARSGTTTRGQHVGASTHKTKSGQSQGASLHRTARGDTSGASTHRTASGDTAGASTHRKAKGATTGASTHRTQSGTSIGASSHKSGASQGQGASIYRTGQGESAGARLGRTLPGETVGARVAHTANSETEASQGHRTQSGEWLGARSFSGKPPAAQRTDAGRLEGQRLEGQRLEGQRLEGQRLEGRRSASAHAAARMPALSAAPVLEQASVGRKTASGRFVPAARFAAASGERELSPVASHGTWALQRLEKTGTSTRARSSLLPRTAPRAPESTYVVHAENPEQVEELLAQIRQAAPRAKVRVRQAPSSAWASSPGQTRAERRAGARTPRLERAVVAAAERANRSPLTSRSASASLAPAMAASAPQRASRVHRSKNPVGYARAMRAPQGVALSTSEQAVVASLGGEVQSVLGGKAPSKVVKTAQGVWIPASSFKTPSAGSWASARVLRTGATQGAGAGSFRTIGGDWRGAARMRTPGGAAQGAGRFHTAALAGGGAQVFLTPDGQVIPGPSTQAAPGSWQGGELAASRPIAWAGARTGVGRARTYHGAERFRTMGGSFAPGARVDADRAGSVGAARRTGSTLEALSAQEHLLGTPSWAERSTKPSRLRTPGDLVEKLVQAQDVQQLVELIVGRGAELNPSMGLSKPVLQVIEQIRTVASAQQLGSGGRGRRQVGRAASSSRRRSAKVIRGFAPLKGAGAKTTAGVGADKVMKLAGKLRGLIHLAETGRSGDAQRQAKLAHGDRPDGRLEQGSDLSNSETAAKQSVDIEALAREVLDVVNREMELRQERRQEESDANVWW